MSTHRILSSLHCTTAAKANVLQADTNGRHGAPVFLRSQLNIQIKQVPKTISHMSFSTYSYVKSNHSGAIRADNNLRI